MEQSFSEETMLASLHDIRLPSEAAGGPLSDWLIGIGLAALAAVLCLAALRVMFAPKSQAASHNLSQDLNQIASLPQGARRVALLHVLKDRAPDRYQALSQGLYVPDQVDLKQLEAEVARLV